MESLLDQEVLSGEETVEQSLRPDSLSAYVGQELIKESLRIAITAAKQRNTPIDHVLLYGPPGLGKTSLAFIIGKEMGTQVRTTSGPAITKAGDIAALLTNLQEGDILFIDEIHRMQRTVEEILYPAMEDRCIDIMLGKGPSARSVRIDLPSFTLVGATTRAGTLSRPLRERFGHIHRLDYYSTDELVSILSRSMQLLGLNVTPKGLAQIAERSRRTPRVANRLLRRVRDFAAVHHLNQVDETVATAALDQLEIDKLGLDRIDRDVLNLIDKQFRGGPVGLETLAAACGEERETLEDIIEPYLLRIGFLERSPRGRVITDAARTHLGLPLPIS
ncbi:MAG TPA: Holliday junction branch migration DNA helicase RuvB [Verrucomicrobiae bacterium]|nr:Holliday junction branch migration DNA helicase RuvB [Verrucomicrobiae bacterium]